MLKINTKQEFKMNKRKYLFLTLSVIMVAFLFIIFCTKITYHGIYSDMYDSKNIKNSDIIEQVHLNEEIYEMSFSPQKQLTGLFIYADANDSMGKITVNTFESDRKEKESFEIDSELVSGGQVVVLKTKEKYEPGHEYSIKFDATSCEDEVNLILVKDGIYSEENIDSSLYIGYGYMNPIFGFEEQLGWFVFLVAVWLMLLGTLWFEDDKKKLIARNASFVILIMFVLSISYTFNSFDGMKKEYFINRYDPSDVLAMDPVYHIDRIDEFDGFGLGYLDDTDTIVPYRSQYGLQGKVFATIAKIFGGGDRSIKLSKLLCSYLTAAVFTGIIYFARKKYGVLFATSFGITVLLSPWVIDYAHSMYWVEFKWFLPMLVGLICSLYLDNKKIRVACYIGTFASLLINSLCGYEYITTVMMGAVAVPLIDLLDAVTLKNKERIVIVFRTILILGICAVLGFVAANIIHADVKGHGDIIAGIKEIWGNDAVRRTSGMSFDVFGANKLGEVNASTWEVIKTYFHFETDIIAGVGANLFPMICFLPLVIFAYDATKQKLNKTHLYMYIVFGLTGMSWFLLSKNHSYIHTYLNYILWYFGFIQTCFFVIANKFVGILKDKE